MRPALAIAARRDGQGAHDQEDDEMIIEIGNFKRDITLPSARPSGLGGAFWDSL